MLVDLFRNPAWDVEGSCLFYRGPANTVKRLWENVIQAMDFTNRGPTQLLKWTGRGGSKDSSEVQLPGHQAPTSAKACNPQLRNLLTTTPVCKLPRQTIPLLNGSSCHVFLGIQAKSPFLQFDSITSGPTLWSCRKHVSHRPSLW